MKYQYNIQESNSVSKISVTFSDDITKDLELVEDLNWQKHYELLQWNKYLDELTQYLSKKSIAWDNTNKFKHKGDGRVIITSDIYNGVEYMIVTDNVHTEYVCITKIDYKLEQYGLRKPSLLGINVTTYESHDRAFISLRDYITEQIHNTSYSMKSLQQYINEKMSEETSTEDLNKTTDVDNETNKE